MTNRELDDGVTLGAVGDISLDLSEVHNPFEYTDNILQQCDVTFGNLEAPIGDEAFSNEKSVSLSGSKSGVNLLRESGFTILNLANNHILDLGEQGLETTIELLTQESLEYTGISTEENSETVIERRGLKLGFLGYSENTGASDLKRLISPKNLRMNSDFLLGRTNSFWTDPELDRNSIGTFNEGDILDDISRVDAECDYCVVSVHWGVENVYTPSPRQVQIAHRLIDSGADIILGHHPHVLQPVERYHGGMIFYSLGNFQFSPELSDSPSNKSMIPKIQLDGSGIQLLDITPIEIEGNVPKPVRDGSVEDITYEENLPKGYSSWFQEIAPIYLTGNFQSYIKRVQNHGTNHFLEMILWLMTPFCIRCYLSLAEKYINQYLK